MRIFDSLYNDMQKLWSNKEMDVDINNEHMSVLESYCDVIDEQLECGVFDDVETSVSDAAITVVLKTPSASFMSEDSFIFILGNAQRICFDAAEETMNITIEFYPTWVYQNGF